MRILDVGCGNAKVPGAIGIDLSADTQADIVHNLNRIPWPVADGEFDRVNCQDVIEHLDDVIAVMEEIHRVTKPGGAVTIRVPHFSSAQAFTDITHKHFFSTQSFDYFSPTASLFLHYSSARFAVESARLTLWRPYRYVGLELLANVFPLRYEKMFAFVFPAQYIEFRLKSLDAARR